MNERTARALLREKAGAGAADLRPVAETAWRPLYSGWICAVGTRIFSIGHDHLVPGGLIVTARDGAFGLGVIAIIEPRIPLPFPGPNGPVRAEKAGQADLFA